MNHLKSFKLFESTWLPEEFVQELGYHLGKYNITANFIREVISKYDIESEIELGKTPLDLSKEIISDLGIDQRGKEGYMKVNIYKPGPDVVKYL